MGGIIGDSCLGVCSLNAMGGLIFFSRSHLGNFKRAAQQTKKDGFCRPSPLLPLFGRCLWQVVPAPLSTRTFCFVSSGKASSVGVNVGNSSLTFVCHSYFVFCSRRKSGRRHPCIVPSVKHCAILIYVRQNEICQSKCQFECSNWLLNDCSKRL